MKYCQKCGKELVDEAVVCPGCGCAVPQAASPTPGAAYDAPSTGFAVLGFFIPLAGLILYLVLKDSTPLKAKSAGKGALAGFITGIALSVIYSIIIAALIGSMY